MPTLSYVVKFDANGGSGGPGSVSYSTGSGAQNLIPNTLPTRAGCTFLGWNTAKAGTGTDYQPRASAPESAATLYAVWAGIQVTSITAYRSNSSGTKQRKGTYGHVSAKTKAVSTVAGTVAVSAVWGASGSSPSNTVSLSNASYAKAAGTDASRTHDGTFGGSLATGTSYTVNLTANLSGTYAGNPYSVSAMANATVPKAWALFSALAGGNGLAVGTTASVANALEVAFKVIQSTTSLGYWLVDRAGHSYPGIIDNGTHMWVGSGSGSSRPHLGDTYIAAGLNATGATYNHDGSLEKASGNGTAYVSTVEQWNADDGVVGLHNYAIWHAGNLGISSGYGAYVDEDVSTSASLANASWTSICSVSLSAGYWLVHYNAYFASNATGRRVMALNTSQDTQPSTANFRLSGVSANAVSGGITLLNGCVIMHPTSTTTYYLTVMQNSGSALGATCHVRAFRLK